MNESTDRRQTIALNVSEADLEKGRALLGVESADELDEALTAFLEYLSQLELLNRAYGGVDSHGDYTEGDEHDEESCLVHPSLN